MQVVDWGSEFGWGGPAARDIELAGGAELKVGCQPRDYDTTADLNKFMLSMMTLPKWYTLVGTESESESDAESDAESDSGSDAVDAHIDPDTRREGAAGNIRRRQEDTSRPRGDESRPRGGESGQHREDKSRRRRANKRANKIPKVSIIA